VELLSPRVACISCGVGNSYGHPHAELLERLRKVGTKIYRTDESGNITVEINGNKMNIRAFLD
jgi:competence protein ComEC